MLDLSSLRSEFPALSLTVNGIPAVFLDAPGGTQVPRTVIDAVSGYFGTSNSNVHGPFLTSRRTDQVIEAAHAAAADLLGCDPDEVVFGANMTTLTFAFSRAIGREFQKGAEIITTLLDHNANVAPWYALAERGARILEVGIRKEDCTLDMKDFARKLSPRTKLVAVGYASNAVGTINPLREIVEMAHRHGALVYVDAVHYAPHRLIDVRDLDCDFLACSVYKFFGPHLGIIYGKREHLVRLRPYKVRPATETLPYRWETGTQNHECMAGTTAAIDYIADLGRRASPQVKTRREAICAAYHWIGEHELSLCRQLISGLLDIPGLTLYGIADANRFDRRTATVGLRIEGFSPDGLARALGEKGIFTWAGNFYALTLTEALNLEETGGVLRIGVVHYNTAEEVERLLAELRLLAGLGQHAAAR
ncbi:MAG: cysteine desulfurase-like protein [Bryobacteraceae bacterium]